MDSNLWEHVTGETASRKIASSTRLDSGPQYSPDGSRIAFESDRGGTQEIWVCDRAGGNATPVTNRGGQASSVRWSPDGQSLVFARWDEAKTNRDVYVVPAAGGTPRRMTTDPAEEGRPSWSRDGKWIYFFSHRTGRSEIWKMPVGGGEAIQITRNGGHESRESMDGRTLYFTALFAPGLKSVPAEGGEEREEQPGVRTGGWDVNRYGVAYVGGKNEEGRHPILLWNPANHRTAQVVVALGEIVPTGVRVFAAAEDGSAYLWRQLDQEEGDLLTIENIKPPL